MRSAKAQKSWRKRRSVATASAKHIKPMESDQNIAMEEQLSGNLTALEAVLGLQKPERVSLAWHSPLSSHQLNEAIYYVS